MREIIPGVFHWTTLHEGIGAMVHSYYIEATRPAILLDPRVPREGMAWFRKHATPAHAYLTNRHHYRHSGRFTEEFGTVVWCHRDGLHEFVHGEQVRPFSHGDLLPGHVEALAIGSLCPEETALLIHAGDGILAIGDAIVRHSGNLRFVPDELMGDDPEAVKLGLIEAFRGHLGRKFDTLLFAHGAPVVTRGKEALQAFLRKSFTRYVTVHPGAQQLEEKRPT